MIKFSKLKLSFRHAFFGLRMVFKAEQSFRLQVLIAGVVVLLMFYLPLHSLERAVLILSIGFVLGLELLNSQIEDILDLIQPEFDGKVKKIKDLSAAAVLIAALAALVVGLLIFLPYFF